MEKTLELIFTKSDASRSLPLPCWHNDYGYQRNLQRCRQLRVPDGAELVSAAAYGAAAG